MLKRKITEYLHDWHEKDKRKALIIEGPRQTGKTTSVVDFVENNYDSSNIVYVNFLKKTELIELFELNLDAERIVQSLKVHYPKQRIVKDKSVIIFDNIQLCSRAINSLRSFTDYGHYDVIGIGSYLEIVYQKMTSFPVGYVDRYHMGSLDFEEFLWANGYEVDMIDVIKLQYISMEPMLNATHQVFMNLFREYMAIGGMPEVVAEYIKERDFKLAYSMLEDLLDVYQSDFIKYCEKRQIKKVTRVFQSLPVQLYKDNKKFQYSSVYDGARASTYKDSVEWLIDSGIVLKSEKVSQPTKPLHTHVEKNIFKLYVHDPGLFVAMLGDEIQLEILRGGMDAYNGAIYESVIATILHHHGQSLYYYEKDSKLDVDFLITLNRELYAVEVKTADNPKSKVLYSLINNYDVPHGIKLSSHNVSVQDQIVTIPIYMTMFLDRS